MAQAMLHSLDRDGTHKAPLQEVEILDKVGDNDYIVKTPDGTRCHALFNFFTGYFFADDVYRIVGDEAKQAAEQPAEDETEQAAGQAAEDNTEDEAEQEAEQPAGDETEQAAGQLAEDETEQAAEQPAEDETEQAAEQLAEDETEQEAETE